MNVVPFVHEGLGNSSYLVGVDDDEALLVDPDRNVDRYLRAADARGWRITTVLETHLHADFISGVHELGARREVPEDNLRVPAGAQARFPHRPIATGERITVAGVQVEAIASPGHTPEHLAYVVRTPAGPPLLFSGGSLIVGGAARTDLIAPELIDELTRAQHRTARQAFSALPDDTLLYPTHGGGSFCSTGSGAQRTSTLGQERATNPVLDIEDEDEFARWFPTTFPGTPAYFRRMRPINQAGPTPRAQILVPPPLSPSDFAAAQQAGALVVDVRPVRDYARAHLPDSLSNPIRDAYATWLGWLVDLETPLLFVHDEQPLERVLDESLLVGFERFAGTLDGGVAAWERSGMPLATADLVDGRAAHAAVAGGAVVLDVREPEEFAAGHVEGAQHVPLGDVPSRLDEIPADRPLIAYCGHGERASTAVSLLERAGRSPLMNIDGGYDAWRYNGP